MQTWIKHTITVALVAIFATYYCGVNMFSHQHIVGGVKVTHSHPYAPLSNGASHSHSSGEIKTISFLSLINFVTVAAIILTIAVKVVRNVSSEHISYKYKEPLFGFKHLRAPPVC